MEAFSTSRVCRSQLLPVDSSFNIPQLTPNRPLTKDDIVLNLEKAVHDRKLEPSVLSRFDTRPHETLANISEDIRKSYGIPARY
jgi:hypothetical protein